MYRVDSVVVSVILLGGGGGPVITIMKAKIYSKSRIYISEARNQCKREQIKLLSDAVCSNDTRIHLKFKTIKQEKHCH